jgi:PAS domain S-box-containing protein
MDKYQNELYLQIIDQFPNPIWRSGTDGKCNFFNKAWLKFTGRTIEQEMGDGWAEGVYKEDFDYCLKTYTEAFAKREHFEMEYRMRHNDGTYRWILDSGSPFFDDNNNFLGYIGSCYDIEDSKKYELLFSNMVSGFAYHKILTDESGKPVDYEFVDVNKSFEEIIGKQKSELVGKRVTEILPGIESDPADWIGKYGQVATTGESIKFENYSSPLGKWFWVSAYSPVKGFFVTIFEDITSRKKAEKEIVEKLEEIQNMNEIMIGRELKMVELKEEIARMQSKQPTGGE